MQPSFDFDPKDNVFQSPKLHAVVEEAVDFFVNTPTYTFPPPTKFYGPGVYALYFVGTGGIYGKLGLKNQVDMNHPIYIGQASPKGVRQARVEDEEAITPRLWFRLSEHRRSIEQVSNLRLSDFRCRFILMFDEAMGLIRTVESALIYRYRPLWNTYIDGFGIHDPGKGRARQLQSEWDSIHPGRNFVQKMESSARLIEPILARIDNVLKNID